jgi:hypothetical protein
MLDETVYNFEGLRSGGTSFIQSESVQPLEDSLDLILAKNFLYEFLCAALSESAASARIRLTQMSLFELPRCQSESSKNLHHYLCDNVHHGCRNWDPCINVEPAEEALYGLEQVYEGIIACGIAVRDPLKS